MARIKGGREKQTRFAEYLNTYRDFQREGQLVMNAYAHATQRPAPDWLPDVWEVDERTKAVQEWYDTFHLMNVSN